MCFYYKKNVNCLVIILSTLFLLQEKNFLSVVLKIRKILKFLTSTSQFTYCFLFDIVNNNWRRELSPHLSVRICASVQEEMRTDCHCCHYYHTEPYYAWIITIFPHVGYSQKYISWPETLSTQLNKTSSSCLLLDEVTHWFNTYLNVFQI